MLIFDETMCWNIVRRKRRKRIFNFNFQKTKEVNKQAKKVYMLEQ